MNKLSLEVEFLCPHDGCTERGTESAISRHMPSCRYAPSSVKVRDDYYELRIDHRTGRVLDRACAHLTDYASKNDALSMEQKNALHVVYQQIVWALSGDTEMQSLAEAGRRDDGA